MYLLLNIRHKVRIYFKCFMVNCKIDIKNSLFLSKKIRWLNWASTTTNIDNYFMEDPILADFYDKYSYTWRFE